MRAVSHMTLCAAMCVYYNSTRDTGQLHSMCQRAYKPPGLT